TTVIMTRSDVSNEPGVYDAASTGRNAHIVRRWRRIDRLTNCCTRHSTRSPTQWADHSCSSKGLIRVPDGVLSRGRTEAAAGISRRQNVREPINEQHVLRGE